MIFKIPVVILLALVLFARVNSLNMKSDDYNGGKICNGSYNNQFKDICRTNDYSCTEIPIQFSDQKVSKEALVCRSNGNIFKCCFITDSGAVGNLTYHNTGYCY